MLTFALDLVDYAEGALTELLEDLILGETGGPLSPRWDRTLLACCCHYYSLEYIFKLRAVLIGIIIMDPTQ